jgi:voltage-gated potassium channel
MHPADGHHGSERSVPDFRRRLFHELEPSHRHVGLSRLNLLIVVVIVASVLMAIVESEPALHAAHPYLFHGFELFFGIFFLIEYIARLWVAPEDPRYQGGIKGRLRYALTPAALLDLLAVLPLLLVFVGSEAYIARMLRLIRVLRLAKLGRFTIATRALSQAVHARRYELMISFGVAIFILILSSTLMYIVEGHVQPETFGSIPRSMWWAIATLTTVGYGDVVPITLPGRILGGITAVTGIGLIAMPTGILAAAMSDAIHARRHAEHKELLEKHLEQKESTGESTGESADGPADGERMG